MHCSSADSCCLLTKIDCQALFCSSDDETSKIKLAEGRSDGRLARRRKRVEKMRAKEAVLREQRHARKELVRVLLLAPTDLNLQANHRP